MPEDASVLLDRMSGFEFEELIADMLTRLQYGSVEKILYTQDGGRDILIRSSDGLIVVECKHHPKGCIGRPVVQKLQSQYKHAVEFRNLSWMRDETWELLRKYGVAYANVDEPLLPPTFI